MWRVKEPAIKKASLNFTSSGQGKLQVSQLVTEGIVLINALELVEWSDECTQILICDHCGISGCSSGGWIVPRRSSNWILLIPVFSATEIDRWSRDEYGPPQYLRKQGAPYFDVSDYERLRAIVPSLPAVDEIRLLEMREAVRLAQSEMPYKIFGEPPDTHLTREKASLVVAANVGGPAEHFAIIENLLRKYYESTQIAELRLPQGNEEIVYLFLDAAEFSDWPALVKTVNGPQLYVDEALVIEPVIGN